MGTALGLGIKEGPSERRLKLRLDSRVGKSASQAEGAASARVLQWEKALGGPETETSCVAGVQR